MKRCCNCGQEYPRTSEYFPPRKRSKDGLLGRCRTCQSAYSTKHYEDNKSIYIDRANKRYEAKRESILDRMRAQYRQNPQKYRDKASKFYHEHRDLLLPIRRKKWAENADKHKDESRKYRENNPVSYRVSIARAKAKKPELYAESKRVIKHRRRARIRGLPDTLTAQEWQHAVEYFGGCCAICGRPPGLWHKLAADHWVAISDPSCPGTVATNIVPLCDKQDGCNQSKGNKPAEQWLVQTFGKRRAKQILDRIEVYFRSLTE